MTEYLIQFSSSLILVGMSVIGLYSFYGGWWFDNDKVILVSEVFMFSLLLIGSVVNTIRVFLKLRRLE